MKLILLSIIILGASKKEFLVLTQKHWKKAIEEELETHEDNKTWKIVPRINSQRAIDSKWVFKVLFDIDVIFLAILTYNGLEIVQIKVCTEFLYGSLEEVYMDIHEELLIKTEKLYFRATDADPCSFSDVISGDIILLALSVDDGLIASKSMEAIHKVVTSLKEIFQITVGEGHCFVGL
ncbi:uncharacterized protein LOC126240477 [Schistocerca nitens]|uniref:uncharacterized protein LOC126240477 n=1 Tax=Schistocerca nitens TaxID=7011 RepID=UPI0021182B93|nr:uncharacterized protein LOC126240477 [Schistocerca nitens]